MSEVPFEDMADDLIRAAQNVATETEWGGGTKSAEKYLERTKYDLLDAIVALQNENKRLREALESLRMSAHYWCEGDPWYSCPKHPDYFGDDNRDNCSCGMDKTNAIIDAALKGGE